MPKLTADQRRALEVLAESAEGCTDHLLQLLGFSQELIEELISAGLARGEAMHRCAERKAVAVRRIKITDTGRQAL